MSVFADAISVRLGTAVVASGEGRLSALGLGSCIAILLHDPVTRTGGLAHVVLPSSTMGRDHASPARFADTAPEYLLDEMRRVGSARHSTVARLAGGACMFAALMPAGSRHIGERNYAATRLALRGLGIPLVGEQVGEHFGRSVVLDVATGRAFVRSVCAGQSEF